MKVWNLPFIGKYFREYLDSHNQDYLKDQDKENENITEQRIMRIRNEYEELLNNEKKKYDLFSYRKEREIEKLEKELEKEYERKKQELYNEMEEKKKELLILQESAEESRQNSVIAEEKFLRQYVELKKNHLALKNLFDHISTVVKLKASIEESFEILDSTKEQEEIDRRKKK